VGSVIQLSTREVLILIGAFAGLVFGFGRLLLSQFERRMQERFDASAALRAEEVRARDARLDAIEAGLEAGQMRMDSLHRTLPLEYVRREDWIRFVSTIDAKLDKLGDMILTRNRGS